MAMMGDEAKDILARLKEVMRDFGISQIRMAEQIGVTQKTLSFWLTGKTYPTAKKVKVITIICDEYEKSNNKIGKSNNDERKSNIKVIEKRNSNSNSNRIGTKSNNENEADIVSTEKVIRGILIEAQAGKELDEGDKQDNDKYREYYNGKVIALTLEDKNNSRLILYPSLSGVKDEWYKMGGQSALFYKYIVGPRLKKKPTIRKDNDIRHRFKYGIVAVHWGERFVQDVTKIGLKVKRIEYGIIIVDLERTYTAKEIEEMRKHEKNEQDRVKKIILPKENYPDLYGLIRQLMQILTPKIKKMDAVYREVFGKHMLETLVKMVEVYFRMANGRMPKDAAREEMLGQVDDMTALLAIADESQLFDLMTRTRTGETLVDIGITIKRRLQ